MQCRKDMLTHTHTTQHTHTQIWLTQRAFFKEFGKKNQPQMQNKDVKGWDLMHAHRHTHTHGHTHTHHTPHTHTKTTDTHKDTQGHTQTHNACTHTHTPNSCTCMHTHTHTHTHHTHTHTHTNYNYNYNLALKSCPLGGLMLHFLSNSVAFCKNRHFKMHQKLQTNSTIWNNIYF